MRFVALALVAGAILVGGPAQAQNIAELRAQYQQTQQMIEQAEAAGVDSSLTSSLRESLEGLRQVIDEMERDQQAAAQASSAPSEPEPTPAPAAAAASEENLAASTCGRFGFTADNYRTVALSGGNDEQIKTLCGQAYEYHSMYKRALSQGHPEAWRTYDAHKKSAAVVNNFYGETAVAPSEGIRPDTKTAQQVVAEQREAAASAAANAPMRPPAAPSCSGCVTPQ